MNPQPHVLFVTGEYPPEPGGVGAYTACLAGELECLGARCAVATGASRIGGQAVGSPVGILRPLATRPPLLGWGELLRAIARLDPDVVHLQYQAGAFDQQPFPSLLPVACRILRPRTRVVVTFHDLHEPRIGPKMRPLRPLALSLLIHSAHAVVVTNHEDWQRIAHYGRPSLSYCIPIGSNIAQVRADPAEIAACRSAARATGGDLLVAFFGFLNEWKGVDELASAFDAASRRDPRLRLVFIGESHRVGSSTGEEYVQAIRQRLGESHARDRVHWTGYLPARDVSVWLQAVDVMALPFRAGASLRHGSLVAAIAHGCPTIVTRPVSTGIGRSLPSLVHRESVWMIDRPADIAALATALLELSADPTMRERLRAGATRLAPAFAWDTIGRATLAAYGEMGLYRRPPTAASWPGLRD